MSNTPNVSQIGNSGSIDLFSTGVSASSASLSENLEIKFKKKLTEEEIIKKFQLKDEDLIELKMKYLDLLNKSETEISEIINTYKAVKTQNAENSKMSKSTSLADDTYSKTTNQNYDFKKFHEITDTKQKIKIVLEEYAKNIYQSQWNNFTQEEKQQKLVEIANNLLKEFTGDENLNVTEIMKEANNPDSKISKILNNPDACKKINEKLSSLMLDIQVASNKGMSVKDLFNNEKINASERNAVRYDYMDQIISQGGSLKDFSQDDIKFYNEYSLSIESGRKFFNIEDLTAQKFQVEIEKYNSKHKDKPISALSLRFDYLKENMKLDDNQRTDFDKLIFKTVKLSNIDEFQNFINLILKSDLSTEEQAQLNEYIKKSGLSNEEFKQFKELTLKSGLDADKIEQYRNLADKNLITKGQLGRFPEADSSNVAMIEMARSEVFQSAMKKYKGNPNAKQLAMTDYLMNMFPDSLSKEEFQEKLQTLLKNCNDRTQISVLRLLKEQGILDRYENYIPTELEMSAGGYAVFDQEQISKIKDPAQRSFWRNAGANYGVLTQDHERVLDFNRSGGDIDLEYQRQLAYEYGNKEDYVEQVVNDFPKNSELYTIDAQKNVLQTGSKGLENLMSEEQINDYANNLGNYAANSNNDELKTAYASSIDTYSERANETVAFRSSEFVYDNPKIINNSTYSNIENIDIKEKLSSLSYQECKDFISNLSEKQLSELPITLCQEFPDLIEKFVNFGKGLDIIDKCDIPSGDRAIALMLHDPKKRKELAAVRQERFSQYTQRLLEETGVIKVNKDNKSLYDIA